MNTRLNSRFMSFIPFIVRLYYVHVIRNNVRTISKHDSIWGGLGALAESASAPSLRIHFGVSHEYGHCAFNPTLVSAPAVRFPQGTPLFRPTVNYGRRKTT